MNIPIFHREEVEFNKKAFSEGEQARRDNKTMFDNPYSHSKEYFDYRSWIAGWADMDMNITYNLSQEDNGGENL